MQGQMRIDVIQVHVECLVTQLNIGLLNEYFKYTNSQIGDITHSKVQKEGDVTIRGVATIKRNTVKCIIHVYLSNCDQ